VENLNKELERLFTSKEAAAKLGVHPKTLIRWTREGRVLGVKFGKYWMYQLSVLEGWLQTISNRGKL
jgi:excisionase family DNA binding protein